MQLAQLEVAREPAPQVRQDQAVLHDDEERPGRIADEVARPAVGPRATIAAALQLHVERRVREEANVDQVVGRGVIQHLPVHLDVSGPQRKRTTLGLYGALRPLRTGSGPQQLRRRRRPRRASPDENREQTNNARSTTDVHGTPL